MGPRCPPSPSPPPTRSPSSAPCRCRWRRSRPRPFPNPWTCSCWTTRAASRSPAPAYDTLFSYPSPAPTNAPVLDFTSYPPEDRNDSKKALFPPSFRSKRILIVVAVVAVLLIAGIAAGVMVSKRSGSDTPSSSQSGPTSVATSPPGSETSNGPSQQSTASSGGSSASSATSSGSSQSSSTTTSSNPGGTTTSSNPPVSSNPTSNPTSPSTSTSSAPSNPTAVGVPSSFLIKNAVQNQCLTSDTSYAACESSPASTSPQLFHPLADGSSQFWVNNAKDQCLSLFGTRVSITTCQTYVFHHLTWYGNFIQDGNGDCLQDDLSIKQGSSSSQCGNFVLVSV
ncbi:hypothetical protein DFJ73DRAFT_793265 [Zopfochytrium polystomum]|nr:hypothetical protein DFJ73DRAFT_793265 [Zopfochytrium polystomum]